MLPKSPSPVPSDDTAIAFGDEPPGSPSSLSISIGSSSTSSSSLVVPDLSDSEPETTNKPRRGLRLWPAADEIAFLEAAVAYKEEHGRVPSRSELAAALRGILSEDRCSAEQISARLSSLRKRYYATLRRLSLGTVPEKDDDVRIYRLSKRVWDPNPTPRRLKKTRAADARQEPRDFSELAELYPCLAEQVEEIDASCGFPAGLLKRWFCRIGDERAARLEAKMKRQRLVEARVRAKLDNLTAEVATTLLEFIKSD